MFLTFFHNKFQFSRFQVYWVQTDKQYIYRWCIYWTYILDLEKSMFLISFLKQMRQQLYRGFRLSSTELEIFSIYIIIIISLSFLNQLNVAQIQGYPKRMRLQRRLYRFYGVMFLDLMVSYSFLRVVYFVLLNDQGSETIIWKDYQTK